MNRSLRSLIVNVMMLVLSSASLFAALLLRFEFDTAAFLSERGFVFPLFLLLFARQITRIYWDLNALAWRYVAAPDLQRIFKAYVTSTFIFAALIFAFSVRDFPRSVLLMEFVIAFMADCGLKFMTRMFFEWYHERSQDLESSGSQDILVVGSGYSGHVLVKTLLSQLKLRYRPIGCLDDLERLQGTSVHGVPVIGRVTELEQILSVSPTVKAVVVAIPSITNEKYREIASICNSRSVLVKRVQSFEDIACLDAPSATSPLTIEALLAKPLTFTHETEIAQRITDQVLMVTGAGGSIGSEICRQLLQLGARRVIFYDNSEYNLYRLDSELIPRFGTARCRSVIGSVRNEARLSEILRAEKPDTVFHAGAFKHVPLMEDNAKEAFRNNVLGTRNVLLSCAQLGVKRFVFISTDKAVDPSNVMGATKRLGELLVQEFSRVASGAMQVAAVRFGNVINSAGSVIPLFKEQIARGGPITVTHPDVERFFMSIPEAVRLVLTAGILGEKGETYVLDMGKKLKIADVARRMLSLYGRRDLQIIFTGLRPGEKLTEELTAEGEELRPTNFAGISELLIPTVVAQQNWNERIENLNQQLSSEDDHEFKKSLLTTADTAHLLSKANLKVA